MITLQKLIDALERLPEDLVVSNGFVNAHSYRVQYTVLAFEPAENIRVGDMLKTAREALNKTFEGYKGGNYLMEGDTSVVLAEYGVTEPGEEITSALLREWRREAADRITRAVARAIGGAVVKALQIK